MYTSRLMFLPQCDGKTYLSVVDGVLTPVSSPFDFDKGRVISEVAVDEIYQRFEVSMKKKEADKNSTIKLPTEKFRVFCFQMPEHKSKDGIWMPTNRLPVELGSHYFQWMTPVLNGRYITAEFHEIKSGKDTKLVMRNLSFLDSIKRAPVPVAH